MTTLYDLEALARELNDAAILENAAMSGAKIYGCKAWDNLSPTAQRRYLAIARRALELLTPKETATP